VSTVSNASVVAGPRASAAGKAAARIQREIIAALSSVVRLAPILGAGFQPCLPWRNYKRTMPGCREGATLARPMQIQSR
jgi:hypothetical protein